jgi:hypothetical protein
MRNRAYNQSGFIGLLLLIVVVLIVAGALAFLVIHRPSNHHTNTQSTSSQQSAKSGLVTLSGNVKQGPSEPICGSSRGDCYQPVPNHTIQAIDSDGKVVGTTKTDGDGKFSLELKPGHYALELVPQADVYHITGNEIDLNTSNHQLDIRLDSAIR